MLNIRVGASLLMLAVVGLSTAAPAEEAAVVFRGLVIPDRSGTVMTVEGSVMPESLGVVMPHEHVFIDQTIPFAKPALWKASKIAFPVTEEELKLWNEPFSARNRGDFLFKIFGANREALVLDSRDDAVAELKDYRDAGGSTIVDVTTGGLGRNPGLLKEVADKSDVKIVMGAGLYRTAWHPDDIDGLSVDDLTEKFVREIVEGVDGTGIRAGIIGEIGAEDLTLVPRDSNEVRVLRAAARASRLTGASITVHNFFGRNHIWHTAIDILLEEGADPARIIMGHVTADSAADLEFIESLLRRGVNIQFDTLGAPFAIAAPEIDNRPNVDAIWELVKRGYASRILLSQDVCTRFQMRKYGGFGYNFVLTNLIPYLQHRGVAKQDIEMMVKRNPRRLLTFVKPLPLHTPR